MTLTAYNHVPIPSFMYGTAWKKEATAQLVQLAVASGFRAIDTANQLIHYQEALVGEALQTLEKKGSARDPCFSKPSLLRRTAKTIGPLTMPRPISPPKSNSPLTAR